MLREHGTDAGKAAVFTTDHRAPLERHGVPAAGWLLCCKIEHRWCRQFMPLIPIRLTNAVAQLELRSEGTGDRTKYRRNQNLRTLRHPIAREKLLR